MADQLEPPETSAADRAHAVVKAIVSAVPTFGGPAAELFGEIVPTSLNRRRQRWFEHVAETLRRLEDRGIVVDDLAEDESFITIVIEASKAALATHIEEKLQILAACIESAALPDRPDDFMAMRLLLYVEELSPEHFLVVRYFTDPAGWYEMKGIAKPTSTIGSPRHILDGAQLGIDSEVLDIVLKDVGDRGLVDSGGFGGTQTANGMWAARTTARGQMLLDFVRLM